MRSRPPEARWNVLECLARVVDHIPEPSQQTVRSWGFDANAARGKRRKPRRPQTPLERHAASTTSSSEPLAHAPPETLELIAESA